MEHIEFALIVGLFSLLIDLIFVIVFVTSRMAKKRHRNALLCVLLALASGNPILIWIILGIIGDKKPSVSPSEPAKTIGTTETSEI